MSKRVTIENLIVCMEELANIRPMSDEQVDFQDDVKAVAKYLRESGEFASTDVVVEFH